MREQKKRRTGPGKINRADSRTKQKKRPAAAAAQSRAAGTAVTIPNESAHMPFSPRRAMKKVRKKYKVFSVRGGVDRMFLYVLMALLVFGLVMLFSSSYAVSYFESSGSKSPSSYNYIRPQLIFAVLGCAIMFAVSFFDYHHLHKFAFPVLGITVVMLVAVLVLRDTSLVPNINGTYRWLYLGPINFQPSEIAKFALILIFAHLISINYDKMETFRYGVLPYGLLLALIAGLVIMEPHVSATVIIVLLAAVMLWVGGIKKRWYLLALLVAVLAAAYLFFFTDKFEYAIPRVLGWLDPFNPPEGTDTWQTQQSLMAIGSGRFFGLGLAQSRQKYLYLPEPENDFIFAIVCEELGFIGALAVIILFALLIWRGVIISLGAKDKFGMMLGIGLTAQVGIQAILNICVVTNTIPNTGISLPFFSYGGTSLVMLLAEMGVVLSISRTSNVDKI